jgi:uncharacterized LabA/DUF88 family protein
VAGPKTIVFIDYQNAHHSAHEMWCPQGEGMEKCVIHPVLLAETVAGLRAPGADLQGIRVYRGRPNPNKQPSMTSANDQQKMHWELDRRCTVIRRALRYPHDWGEPGCVELPREKGIDVHLAVDMVRMAIAGEFEVGILFSRDTDLTPALEAIRELKGPHVEAATWEGASRLRLESGKKLFCHKLDEQDFRAVIDRKHYVIR